MDKFTAFSISVTQEINSNKVLTFIRTQIELQNLLISDKSYFYFKFIPEVLKYEIILFSELEDIYSSRLFSFDKLCADKDLYTLFITDSFFVLYQNKEVLLGKKISHILVEDIQSYIEQTYKIKASKIIVLNELQVKELVEKNKPLSKKEIAKKLYKVIPNNSFKYFLVYLVSGSFLFLALLYNNYNSTNSSHVTSSIKKYKVLTKEEIVYKKHTNKNSSQTLLSFLEFIEKREIELKTVEYSHRNLTIQLISAKKKKLLEVLEYPLKRLVLKSIKKVDTANPFYIMEINLHD